MQWWLIGFVLVVTSAVHSQSRPASFASIDWKMQQTEAPSPDSLGRFIAASYSTPVEKVRAVYSWITSHIAYNTTVYKPRKAFVAYPADPMDTAAVWPSGDEMTARKVMLRREAVCDGYSRLFKVVCHYAGIEAEVITGYGRTNTGSDRKFRTNHTWNAVKIDSTWHLLDLTWAAGHINFLDDFVAKQNDFYFLTPPELFIHDHFPEELSWTLLPQPPAPVEFKKMPFRSKNYIKYDIVKFAPSEGILEAAVGDTLAFTIQLNDGERVKKISADPFVDTSSFTRWPFSSFIKPVAQIRQDVLYAYVVEPKSEWLNLLFNGDIIMRYRIKCKEKQTTDLAGY